MNKVIELHNVSFSYGLVPVLQHIDFSVEQGEFLGIVGPNAGGKSTMLKLILGLIKPQTGTVTVLGKNLPNSAPRLVMCHNIRALPVTFLLL